MSHDEQYNNKWGQIELDKEELQVLNDWIARFEQKYPVVGKVIE